MESSSGKAPVWAKSVSAAKTASPSLALARHAIGLDPERPDLRSAAEALGR
jgi:hypothetical protein